jgi:hypothetical protein
MAYGNAQRLGETINPALMQADYSGFANAGAILGNTLANTGQQIGDAIKTSKENERKLKKAEKVAKSIQDLAIPGLSEMGESALSELANPDLTTNQKLAIAEGIEDSLKIGVLGIEQKRADAMLKLQQDQLGAKISAAGAIDETPKGAFMSKEEFSSLLNSGVPVKGVPTQDGRIYVTAISGNQPGVLGTNVAIVDGKPVQLSTPQVELPTWGGANNYPDGVDIGNAIPIESGGTWGATQGGSIGKMPSDNVKEINTVAGNQSLMPTNPVDTESFENPLIGTNPNAAQQIQGAQNLPTTPVPTGDVWRMDRDGLVSGAGRVEGSTAEIDYKIKEKNLAKAEADLEAEKRKNETEEQKAARLNAYKTSMADNVLLNINNAIEGIENMPQATGVVGGVARAGLGLIPNSSVEQVDLAIGTIENIVAADKLREMRNNSPTGGALGNTSNADIELLKKSIINLKTTQDPKKLKEALYVVQMRYLDSIHGSESERQKLLRSGQIDQDSFNYVESLYPPIKINDKGQIVPKTKQQDDPLKGLKINSELRKKFEEYDRKKAGN